MSKKVWAASHGRPISETLADIAPHLDPIREQARIREIMLAQGDAYPAHDGARSLHTGLPSGSWAVVTSAKGDGVRHCFALAGLPIPEPRHWDGFQGAALLSRTPRWVWLSGKAAGMTGLSLGTTHEAENLREADRFESTLSDRSHFQSPRRPRRRAAICATLRAAGSPQRTSIPLAT